MIAFNIYPTEYRKHKDKYDLLVSRIKQDSKLALAYFVTPKTFDILYGRPPTFEEYLDLEKTYTTIFMTEYDPDYYFIVVEPVYSIQNRIRVQFTLEQWEILVDEVATLVKSIDKDTVVITGLNGGELKYRDVFSNSPNVDVVAFNAFQIDRYEDNSPFTESIEHVKNAKGKEVWIWMTWWRTCSAHTNPPSPDPECWEPYTETLDSKWMKVVTYYAQRHGITNVNPFWSDKFVSSDVLFTENPTEYQQALRNRDRTITFCAYNEAIAELSGSRRLARCGS
jgi:hypothetical protein